MEFPPSKNFVRPFKQNETSLPPVPNRTTLPIFVEGPRIDLPVIIEAPPTTSDPISFRIENLTGFYQERCLKNEISKVEIPNCHRPSKTVYLPAGMKTQFLLSSISTTSELSERKTGIRGNLIVKNLLVESVKLNGFLKIGTLTSPINSRILESGASVNIDVSFSVEISILNPGRKYDLNLSLLTEHKTMSISSETYQIEIPTYPSREEVLIKEIYKSNASEGLKLTWTDEILTIQNISLTDEFNLVSKLFEVKISGITNRIGKSPVTEFLPIYLGFLDKKYIWISTLEDVQRLILLTSSDNLILMLIKYLFEAKLRLLNGLNCQNLLTTIFHVETFLSNQLNYPRKKVCISELLMETRLLSLSPGQKSLVSLWLKKLDTKKHHLTVDEN